MVIHYSVAQGNIACGRVGSSLNRSEDAAEVSCKLCLRSVEKKADEPVRKTPTLAELRAAAKMAKAERVTVATAQAPSKGAVRAEWRQRLEQLPGRNRLPRGCARQTFI
ncbi:hypothetical protein [Stutzerimonas stutzeri]|uniref:hypothetical protein n=1 Tax=Stutzerimonas stutzeri TaxID=316 RepID=UPI0020C6F349|nr:hypothetical protein [Stutzerimonas stutzeri]